MTNDITFLIRISSKNDFAKCSNFINKVMSHQELDRKETENIVFLRGLEKDQETGDYRWRRNMLGEYKRWEVGRESRFQLIKEPGGIKDLNSRFPVSYLLYIEQKDMAELAQFKELILLFEGYKEANIYSFIKGDKDFYFKLSQYLFAAINALHLRDRIFYETDGKLKRFQENALQSARYLPLVIVNEDTTAKLKQKCKSLLNEDVWLQILDNEVREYARIKKEVEWLELGGIIKLLIENKTAIEKLPSKEVYAVLSELDVLALAFFAYSLVEFKENLNWDDLVAYVKVQQQYANACHQLLENILFHSAAKWGILSIRMHKSDSEKRNDYLYQQYGLENGNDYFEVCIYDFAGNKKNRNIAENFIEKLDDKDRVLFQDICPEDLFKSALGEADRFEASWGQYYREASHFGRHVGLRIFQNITRSNDGCFIAESHREHRSGKGEMYCYRIPGEEEQLVMPGTAYHILFPLRKSQISVNGKDISQEYGDWITQNPERLLKLKSCVFTDKVEISEYHSQKEKEDCIIEVSQAVLHFLSDRTERILAIDASAIRIGQVELWVKGLMRTAFALQCRQHFVFYHCTEEFMNVFYDVIRQVFQTVQFGMFQQERFQIALISESYEQVVYLPGDIEMTDALNKYYSIIKGIKCRYLFNDSVSETALRSAAGEFIPFETLVEEKGETFFEKYVMEVLQKDIQGEEFGCQIMGTHMRLGSTIHINKFCEGELLFGNRYFVSRFAFLMLQEMYEDIKAVDKIMLYGYANYSETLMVALQSAIAVIKGCDKKEIEYIILEREEEHRDAPHVDNIRYNNSLLEAERKKYMQERFYIVVVPINSTLKTHQRLLSLLREQNENIPEEQILRNYALILVGPQECQYWKKTEGKELECKYNIQPKPRYLVSVPAEYQESLTCNMCFPKNPLHEIPLVEVNAASTIPNQAFGIITGATLEETALAKVSCLIQKECKKLEVLKDCLLYGHTLRNDTHYLYYIKTEKLVVKAENGILQSLKAWKNNVSVASNEYHVIVTPAHFSNCRFVEMVNNEIFGGMATVLRIDFNKDYRANTYAKYSNIRQYIRQMEEMNENMVMKFHYVDDNIITGKTFYRAKSIVESILEQYKRKSSNVEAIVFDRIFTLIDRNSAGSRMQYVGNTVDISQVNQYFYYFLHLEISSLRNYGDSCIVCKLHNEAKRLRQAAATKIVADYWETSDGKFQIRPLADAVDKRDKAREEDVKKEDEYKNRSYRRLFCTHTIRYILEEIGYDNQTVHAARIILKIMIEDYKIRLDKEEAFEYFVSYLKTASRPFLVFNKAIKEAVFDILLIIIEYLIKNKSIDNIISERGEKEYWLDLQKEWSELHILILNRLNYEQRRQVVLVIMKQLTEMKGNYILRLENMNALFDFVEKSVDMIQENEAKESVREDFWNRYVIMIKKLTGISSDTSKSVWLDYALRHRKELVHNTEIQATPNMNRIFMQSIVLENTVNYQDGIGKIYRQVKDVWKDIFIPVYEQICKVERATLVAEKYFIHWKAACQQELENMNPAGVFDELLMHLSTKSFFSPARAEAAYQNEDNRERIMELAERFLNEYIQAEPKTDYAELKKCYSRVTQGYQLANFLYYMKEMDWYRDEEGFTDEGIVQITGCLLIKYLCEENKDDEKTLLQKIDAISKVAGWILGDVPVKMLVEYHDSAEFYKEEINYLYQSKVCEFGEPEECRRNLDINTRKHYHTVGDNIGYIDRLDKEEQSWCNETDILKKLDKYGYYLTDACFIWKIGRKSKYPIYFLAKLNEDDARNKDIIYSIRNLLSLSNDVENCLAGKQNYLHETELANSRLSVLQREKSSSHTKEENRINNFNHLMKGVKPRKDDTLVLLADLDISRIFRNSLNREFYHETDVSDVLQWDAFSSIIKPDIYEGMHGNNSHIAVRKRPILPGDKMLKREDEIIIAKERGQELMSILLALILNVKEKGRGKVNNSNKFKVYISKSQNGMLHILNETECEKTALQRVRGCMEQEPVNEESGITLWALNSYIKRVKVAFANEILSKMRPDNMDAVANALKRLTGQEFALNVEIVEAGGKRYFLYEVPVMRQKYMQLITFVDGNKE